MTPTPGDITVIIPTFKRPDALLQTLTSLQTQTLQGFEILVADNAAQEPIRAAIEAFNERATTPATYFPEPRPGVHFARNSAARRARGSLLLFTDDDMTFVPGWVSAYANAFAEHPSMTAAAGPIHLKWEAEPPAWLRAYVEGMSTNPFGFLDKGPEFSLSPKNGFHSGNMAIRKDVLIARGGFHPEATGAVWLGDGETGLNIEMWNRGDAIGYVPSALNFHHIPPQRMSLAYLKRRQANEGMALAYTRFHKDMPSRSGLIAYMARVARRNYRHLLGGWAYRGRTDVRGVNIQLREAMARAQIGYAWKVARDPQFRELVTRDNWIGA